MDKETMMSICIVIGVALVMFGAAKVVRAVIKAEKEIKKHSDADNNNTEDDSI